MLFVEEHIIMEWLSTELWIVLRRLLLSFWTLGFIVMSNRYLWYCWLFVHWDNYVFTGLLKKMCTDCRLSIIYNGWRWHDLFWYWLTIVYYYFTTFLHWYVRYTFFSFYLSFSRAHLHVSLRFFVPLLAIVLCLSLSIFESIRSF